MHTDLGNEVSSQSGSDDTEDAASASDDGEDLDAELNDIRNDFDPSILEDEEAHILNRPSAPAVGGDSEQLGTLSRRRPRKARGLGLIASSFLVDENGTPYPERYDNPLLDMFADDEPVGRAASPERTELGESGPESRRYRRNRPEIKNTTQSGASTRPPGRNGRNARDRKPEPETPATVRLESSDDSRDDDFELSDDTGVAEDDSDKENATPGSQTSTEVDVSRSNVSNGHKLVFTPLSRKQQSSRLRSIQAFLMEVTLRLMTPHRLDPQHQRARVLTLKVNRLPVRGPGMQQETRRLRLLARRVQTVQARKMNNPQDS